MQPSRATFEYFSARGGRGCSLRHGYRLLWFWGLLLTAAVFESSVASTTTASQTAPDDWPCDPYSDTPCEDPNASCSYDGWPANYTCKCNSAYQRKPSTFTCVPAAGYAGGQCLSGGIPGSCYDSHAFCSQTDNMCQCNAPYLPRAWDLACVFSECGGTLTSPSGTIVSPNITSIPDSGTECLWTITTDDTYITAYLNVQLGSFQWTPDCVSASVEVWGGDSINPTGAYRTCHAYNFMTVHSVDSVVNLRFFVTPGHESASFSATWTSVCAKTLKGDGILRSLGFPDSYPADRSCSFHFSYYYNYEIRLTFTAFSIPSNASGSCGRDYVQVFSNHLSYAETFCGTDLPPSQTGVSSVSFVSGDAAGAGFGFEATYTTQLRCGITNLTDNNGYISYGCCNHDQLAGTCTWTITPVEAQTVLLYISGLYLQTSDGCLSEYVKIYDGPNKDDNMLMRTYCGYVDNIFVESTSDSTVVEFYTNGTFWYPYLYLQYQALSEGCEDVELTDLQGSISLPGNYNKNGVCRWTITVPEGLAVQLAFDSFYIDSTMPSDPEAENASDICPVSSLTVYDGTIERDDAIMAKLCGWEQPWLMTSASNKLLVVVLLGGDGGYTSTSMSAHYVSVQASQVNRDCGDRNLTGIGGEIASPNFSSVYGKLLDCEWLITLDPAFIVQLYISEINLDYSPNCRYDSLQVRNGGSIYAPSLTGLMCSSWYPGWHIQTSSNRMLIKLVKYSNGTNGGFSSTWSRICQKEIYANSSTLQSPYYPRNYTNDLACRYTFYMYSPGYRLVLDFTALQLEAAAPNGSCVNDFIQIDEQSHWTQNPSSTQGPDETVSRRFCGDSLPGVITAYYHTVLHFISNGDTTASGFHLIYDYLQAECGESQITGQTGTVTSPGYPGSFPQYIRCVQRIVVPVGETISLVFDTWSLGSGTNVEGEDCRRFASWGDSGVLEIFDGDYVGNESVPLGIFCGMVAPLPLTSASNVLTLVFYSQHIWNPWSGFSATYTSSGASNIFDDCGGELNGTEGSITSPFYPELYPNNSRCEWIITGDPGDTIRMSFVDFHLQDSTSCHQDSLELRDGDSASAPRLDRMCGDVIPLDVTSTSNVLYAKFISDFDKNYKGFSATWVSLCEEVFTTSSGTITSPSSTGKSRQCTYIIEQPDWSVFAVRFQFLNFQLGGDPSNCGQNYVEVRDGGFQESPLLGQRYCGNTLPHVLTSSQNMMWVRYVTDGSASNVGFRATFSLAEPSCGRTILSDKEGFFTTPAYPNNYPNGMECTWEIRAAENHVIQLTFDTFLLEGPSSNCRRDWIRIYDGNALRGEYCGVSAPDIITSTGNRMTVIFRTDWSVTFEGFRASYISYDPSSDDPTGQYNLYPFGADNGDIQLQDKAKPQRINIKTGFPVGKKLVKKIFVAFRGVVSFDERENGKEFELKKEKMMICPYNTDIWDGSYTGGEGVFYQLHTKNPAVLDKATAEVLEFTHLKHYKASLVLVVTWNRVKHRSRRSHDEERATVQLALISDGMRSFAMVYYQKGAMKWSYLPGEPLVIGMSLGSPESVAENMFSGKAEAFKSLDGIAGNTGRQGMWIYEIGDSYSADQACQDWYDRNLALDAVRQAGFRRLPQCPCNSWWIWGNWRWAYWRENYRVQCYRMTVGSSRSVAPYGKECCYNNDWWSWFTWGQYLSDAPHAGSATAFNPAFWSLLSDYQLEDRDAHDICCYNTTSSDYCRMYYELRPIGHCTTRIPFRISWTWGDPHILTLDGGTYTFNGWGEYTMITMATADLTFTLQGRTGLAETESGSVANATVFTAFGAAENGIIVTVDIDPNTNDTMIIYANGTDYTTDFYQQGDDFEVENEAFLLTNTNSSFKVTFTSGIQLTISVGFKALDISVTMPVEFQGLTRGLLGNFNGDKDDDFVLPDGTALPFGLSERQIFEKFGPRWAVTESNTVLRYPPREGPANYAHPEFVPTFLDEQPADMRQAAEDLCGATNLACVYDYVATGSAAFANASRDTADDAERTEAVSKNTVPVLQFNGTLIVTSGTPTTFNLDGYDPDDGDTLTYYVVGEAGDSVKVDNATGDVTVTLTASNPVALSFFAKDSNDVQSPKRDATVIVCPICSSHGTCNTADAVASDVSGFMNAVCTCGPAWTGPECSEDYDACGESPCSAHQTCVDLTPEQQGTNETGFTCMACADGFEMDPEDPTSCIDVNECDLHSAICAVNCTNLPGSYQCGCPHGFRLNPDGVSCDDINECADRTAGCQQQCVNTEGSFLCMCYPGYTLSDKGTCKADQSTADLCSAAGCSHGCTTADTNGTVVASCFCNVGFIPDPSNSSACVDLDECQEGFCSQNCTNTYGSFACTCYTGHVLGDDQRTCSPCQGLQYGPECRLKCTCNGRAARCDPVSGCVCKAGWTGRHCQHDVNECEENPDVCPKGQICSNTNGSYVCHCPAGYDMNADGFCQDVNECVASYLQPACRELETCHNVEGSYYCTCISGYTCKNGQCIDIDECAGSIKKCQQLCINRPGSYNCDCYYGYRLNKERTHCIQVGDVCKEFEGLECSQGCTLDDVTDRAVCFCDTGYKLATDGQTCFDENECASGVAGCSHTCINTLGGFTCSCPVGKMLDNDRKTCFDCPTGKWGENCIHECACGAGATGCDAAAGCQCKSGWTGEKCDQDVDECDTEAAQLECQARGAVCQNLQGSYRCQCQSGYRINADGDCEDINECANSLCGQQCENTPGSYRCLCNKGFTLNATTGQCHDVNECALSITNNCTQLCINTPGGYRCDCHVPGLVLDNDGLTCKARANCSRTDCPTENGGCSQEHCFCNSGYELSADNSTCNRTAVDWCAQNLCEQTCTASSDGTSYNCGCNDGYLLNADKSTCRECQSGTYGPGCKQTCTCNMLHTTSCDKADGTCSCKAGWEGPTCGDDIDECSPSFGVTCPAHSQCVNTMGGYLCICNAGYSKKDGVCKECDANFFGVNCAQQCTCSVNTVSCDKVNGACTCKAGWEGTRCDKDIDECMTGADDCSGAHVICVDTDGGFQCECDWGYTRNDTTRPCVDRDECFSKDDDCLHECTNTEGGYVCTCGPEYEGTGNDCRRLTVVPMQLTVDIPVSASEVSNPYSQTYKNWAILMYKAIHGRFSPSVPGLKTLLVRSLRPGSVVAMTDCVLDIHKTPDAVSYLATAILSLVGNQLTVGGLTGDVVVTLSGVAVNGSMTLCDVYVAISPCMDSDICQERSGIATCVATGSHMDESKGSNDLQLIIGLAVSIPVALLVAIAITVAMYIHKRTAAKTVPLVNEDVYRASPTPSSLLGTGEAVGPAATQIKAPSRMSASPVPSLDGILSTVDSRPTSRKGSWTDST